VKEKAREENKEGNKEDYSKVNCRQHNIIIITQSVLDKSIATSKANLT